MRTFRVAVSALVFLLVPLSASAYDVLGLNGVNPILMGPGQLKLQVSWNWPPWGANMRVEYGPSTSYGSATNWVPQSGYPFSGTSELMLSGLPDGALHYRVVITPSGGPPGQDGFTSGDMVVTPASSAVDLCQRNCPDADANCKSQCTKDPGYFDKALAACQAKCRADDPDCPAICHNNLSYVSNPPTIVTFNSSYRCPAGWSLHHVFVDMDYSCHPVGSDFCKDKQSFRSKFDTVCTQPKDPQFPHGDLNSMVNTESPCTTRRGAGSPNRSAGGNWWQTAFGAWECIGNYGDCQIQCPQ